MKINPNVLSFFFTLFYTFDELFNSEIGREFFKRITKCWQKSSAESNSLSVTDVPEINIFSEKIFKEFVATGKPIVIRGAAKEWKSVKEWDLDFFGNAFSNEKVLSARRNEIVSFPQAIESVKKMGEYNINFYPIQNLMSLKDWIDINWLNKIRNEFGVDKAEQLFISCKDYFTYFHSANTSNFFIQVKGKKRWWICSHKYTYALCPTLLSKLHRRSQFDPRNPDLKKFPLIKDVEFNVIELNAGDILWVPPFAWHFVQNLETSIGIASKQTNFMESFRIAPYFAVLEFFKGSFKQLSWRQKLEILQNRYPKNYDTIGFYHQINKK